MANLDSGANACPMLLWASSVQRVVHSAKAGSNATILDTRGAMTCIFGMLWFSRSSNHEMLDRCGLCPQSSGPPATQRSVGEFFTGGIMDVSDPVADRIPGNKSEAFGHSLARPHPPFSMPHE
ncbi:predicted protein [Uncinocarpus reesii 1704]|uniref:Uncharacterized protein n=1 Tax=Uncinocarpus reesii (strain UAMH 1704) TaxID=336963 RepID=C4JWG8_UNCRE|nr:uncharacterized protein UREG_06910 [Uncinocarpus reesii 1704]EEP82045.1 predicted protein [Uncinocarpus reesii 1704]